MSSPPKHLASIGNPHIKEWVAIKGVGRYPKIWIATHSSLCPVFLFHEVPYIWGENGV